MLTERQQKWFATVRATLERDSGKTLEQWAELARACPETKPMRRLAWMKDKYGLGRNQASMVLNAAFPPDRSWSAPDALETALWSDPTARRLFELIKPRITTLPAVIVGQRKGFTAFSREFQFAALRPVKQWVLMGLAIDPEGDSRLLAAAKEGWSERLKSKLTIQTDADIDARLDSLLRKSWEIS
jgi:hypothetical protein